MPQFTVISVTNVSKKEWRWVILLGGLLVAFTLIPYVWALTAVGPTNTQFMGILYNPLDGASYLAKIGEGMRGAWLFTLVYTPEPHDGALIQVFYLLLGHLAGLLGLSPQLMFHIMRMAMAFMMYIAIYHLGSTIWSRMRPRRLFFALAALGSGLGWLAIIATGNAEYLTADLKIPEAIPFYATLMNPHFPLTIGLIALLASTFIMVFRPGFAVYPTLTNGGGSVVLITLALMIVQPQGWLPIAAALAAYIAVQVLRSRILPRLELSWVLLVILPAIPVLIYYVATINSNEALRIWNTQNVTPSPTPDGYLLGFGLLLIVALPGIWRGIRRFERDGDRFMLVWLVVNALLLYAPFNLQRRLVIGMIIPIIYFGVRSLEDFWFNRISPKWRDAALVTFLVFIMPSNILAFGLPLVGVVNPSQGLSGGLLLQEGYGQAIQWLDANAAPGAVVLAPSKPSLWMPAYANLRVVYGHPFETMHAKQKEAEVRAWYNGEGCQELIERYDVRYILAKRPEPGDFEPGWPEECLAALGLAEPLETFGPVSIYMTP